MILVKNQLFQMIEETIEATVLYVAGVYALASLCFWVFWDTPSSLRWHFLSSPVLSACGFESLQSYVPEHPLRLYSPPFWAGIFCILFPFSPEPLHRICCPVWPWSSLRPELTILYLFRYFYKNQLDLPQSTDNNAVFVFLQACYFSKLVV